MFYQYAAMFIMTEEACPRSRQGKKEMELINVNVEN